MSSGEGCMKVSQPQRVNSGAAEDKINTTRDPNIHSRDSRQMTGAGEEKSIAARPPQTPTIPIPEKGGSGEQGRQWGEWSSLFQLPSSYSSSPFWRGFRSSAPIQPGHTVVNICVAFLGFLRFTTY